MAVFRSIVQALKLPMLDSGHDLSLGRGGAGEFVGDHHTRSHALRLEQLAPQALGGCRSRRLWLAKLWPNFIAHCRTVSWLTRMPRAASISSTIRRPSGNRQHSHTAWLITSAGKR